MKVLLIGGTGTISMAISRLLIEKKEDLYLLNRGHRNEELPSNIHTITEDINDEEAVKAAIKDMHFDCICDCICFEPEDFERDFRLFNGKTDQYIYISSGSVYQKPVQNYIITENTKLENPFWDYSKKKIIGEEIFMKHYKEDNFPVTIVRPSLTYDERSVPMSIKGSNGSWQVLKRMLEGKPVIIQGDGNSLWTMTHNTDFAKGFYGLICNPKAIGEAFHITSDESLTWNQIFEYIAEALGVGLKPYHVSSDFLASVCDYDFESSLPGDKACSVVFDNTKIKSFVPDFKATVPFKDGIKSTIDNILKHPELQKDDPEFDEWCDKVIASLEKAKKEIK